MDPDGPIDVPATLMQDPGADLLSTYWPSAIGLGILAIIAVLAVRTVRRRRSAGRRKGAVIGGWSIAGALALAVSLALGVNTWVGYFPSVAAMTRWVDGKVREPVTTFPKTAVAAPDKTANPLAGAQRVTTQTTGYAFLAAVTSTSTKVPSSGAWVYLPPGYDEPGNTRRYPVVYALHGSPGSAADWFAGGRIDYMMDTLIAAGSIPPMIVVSPDLNAGISRVEDEPMDIPGGPQIETFVVKDVVPWADANFRTLAEPGQRVVAGMSSGGLASLLYTLHEPALFGGAISILPYTQPYTSAVVADPAAKRRNSPLVVISERATASGQKFFLGQGDGEPTKEATQIRDALRSRGDITTLRVLPGLAHNWTAARTIMPYGLIWMSAQLGWNPS